jgi:hypothetical protein
MTLLGRYDHISVAVADASLSCDFFDRSFLVRVADCKLSLVVGLTQASGVVPSVTGNH